MALMREQERICRELGNKAGLQASLGNQSLILLDRGDLESAMALMREQERLCREVGLVDGLTISLANQALLLRELDRAPEALRLAEEAQLLAEGHGLVSLAQRTQSLVDNLRSGLA